MSCLGERRLLAKHDKTHTAWHRSRYRATPRCKWGVRPALRIHGHAQGGVLAGNLESLSPWLTRHTSPGGVRSSTPLELKPTRKMGKKTPVASRRSAAVTDAGMRQHPPLGKPARVSDSRRESSVSESEAFSSRAGLCGGNAAVRTHWKTTVTNETGYRRGGLERKKRPGHPLFPATLQRERASVHEHCRQMWPYLVDPASSHMLVSKIKPCMSKYILLHSETANGSLNQLWFIRWYNPTWITVVILELIHATKLRPHGKSAFIRSKPIGRKAVLFGDSG